MNTVLASLAAIIFSLALEYFPGLSGWYDALENKWQKLVALGTIVLAAVVAFGVSCTKFTIPGVDLSGLTCDQAGLESLTQALIAALVANQATYLIARKTNKPSA